MPTFLAAKPAAHEEPAAPQSPSGVLAPAGPSPINFGERVWRLRAGDSGPSLLLRARPALTGAVAVALIGALAVAGMAMGSFTLTPAEVLQALLGQGTAKTELVVISWRLPRVLMAIVIGGALGISGAIFQSLTRNPLGSPDIIGFNAGAYTGALISMLLLGGGFLSTTIGAFAGGLATAAVVYLLAFKRGIHGFRLIIVGIGISAMLGSINTWMIIKADLQLALMAAIWGSGSLNTAGWERAVPLLLIAVALVPALMLLSRPLQGLEMGDDAAAAQGISTEGAKLWLLVIGVCLTAICTAAAGPISFVALAAPQIARRMTASGRVSMVSAAVFGALLLLASDLLAQHALAPIQLPVGVVTVSLGGIYLMFLLFREAKRS
ncbi:iron chelate uptake ABC transporter family permease subunit [Paeniglutamicibacter sp. Y32M11]|uniref:FecCD family ABC transporter permease n=1 Tax=Paeniglutamicibacter sp. Y32M11 TaxID=2853258 RepID=UPI001C53221F|nr:iron chelate uptake ABC transporter family permease subunit [Paeniglutamicibacter sp. Y32M11]QXQ09836.1 iron chelate uptake ABC transporter family permease subunit [Paeniglutamicibacter sp. Y32M11]